MFGLTELGVQSFVVDLADLGFIDSTGLSELVQARKRSRAAGGDVVLRAPGPPPARCWRSRA